MSAFPPLDHSRAIDAATSARSPTSARASKFGTFAITFGITFAILYHGLRTAELAAFFTYHPAVGKLDFWMQRARSGEGPAHVLVWLACASPSPGALMLGWIATMIPGRWLYPRDHLLFASWPALWPAAFAFFGLSIADRAIFDAEFLKSIWISAIPALVGAAAASCFVTPPMGATCLGPAGC